MIRKIVKYKNSKIRIPSTEVKRDYSIRKLIQNMTDTLKASGGVGLAAPQIGVTKRVILIHEQGKKEYFLINPRIIEYIGVEERSEEACLSIPGKIGIVLRNNEIMVEYMDTSFKCIRGVVRDLEAFVIQHEIDHLDGVLFIDKLV